MLMHRAKFQSWLRVWVDKTGLMTPPRQLNTFVAKPFGLKHTGNNKRIVSRLLAGSGLAPHNHKLHHYIYRRQLSTTQTTKMPSYIVRRRYKINPIIEQVADEHFHSTGYLQGRCQ